MEMEILPYTLVDAKGSNGKLGLIVLRADETVESDFKRLFPSINTTVYTTRITMSDELTEETLAAMAHDISASANLLPHSLEFDAIGYCCTSAAANIGSEKISQLVQQGAKCRHVVDPLCSVLAALSVLQVKRIAVLTPYIPVVSAAVINALERNGYIIQAYGSFNELLDPNIARIDPQSILAGVLKLGKTPDVDAVFISCTNLRALDIIPSAEEALGGTPVISSNLALAWYMNEVSGLTPLDPSLGSLLSKRIL